MLSVELDIFSGMPNPTWVLSEKEEAQLVDRVMADKSLMLPLPADTGGLGYRGFIVSAMSEDNQAWHKAGLPSTFRLGGVYDAEKSAALWLLDTSEKPNTEVEDYLRGIVQSSILEQFDSDSFAPEGYGMSCASNYFTSDVNFSFWNGSSYISRNNCYNYASNYRSNTFAQPGRKAGRLFSSPPSCGTVGPAVRADGYVDACLGGTAKNITICLVIWPDKDFHFYRLCTNGHWCHKPGQTAARNYDNSGRLITNPQTCNRGYYTVFCEYFYANSYVVVS